MGTSGRSQIAASGVRLRALVVTGHPGPSLVLAAIIVSLAAGAGATAINLLLLALAALLTQLSMGWANDVFDAPNDAANNRDDKPIVRGDISRRAVLVAAAASLVLSVGCGFALGWWPGLVNVAMVGLGWVYDAGLKSSIVSGLLFVLGFGLIPVFSTSVLPGAPLPRAWTVVAAALLGLGGHFVNALPDLDGDLAQGVYGLPQQMARRLGKLAVRVTAFALVLMASAVIAFAGRSGWPATAVLVVCLVLSVAGLRARGRVPFLIALVIAALDTALLVFNSNSLVG